MSQAFPQSPSILLTRFHEVVHGVLIVSDKMYLVLPAGVAWVSSNWVPEDRCSAHEAGPYYHCFQVGLQLHCVHPGQGEQSTEWPTDCQCSEHLLCLPEQENHPGNRRSDVQLALLLLPWHPTSIQTTSPEHSLG